MNKSEEYLTGLTLVFFVFLLSFNYSSSILANSISFKEQYWGMLFFILPVIYVVYSITKDPTPIPSYIQLFGLLSSSLFIFYSFTRLLIEIVLLFVEEETIFNLWNWWLIPLFSWFLLILISVLSKVEISSMRISGIIKLMTVTQIILIIGIILSKLYSGKNSTFYVKTPEYIITYLSIVTPLGYLLFFKTNIDYKKFTKNFFLGLTITIVSILCFSLILLKGSPLTSVFNIEYSYYIESLNLNYGENLGLIIGLLITINQFLIGTFIYLMIIRSFNMQHSLINNRRSSIIVTGVIIFTGLVMAVTTINSTLKDSTMQIKLISSIFQMLYTLLIICYGFFQGLRKYNPVFIKIGLYIFPSFILIYIVHYLSKVWSYLPSYIIERLLSVQNIFLIVSLFVILYYTFETVLLWFAYANRKTTSDINPIIVEKKFDIYVMIPCMNEALVIGSTLTSILNSSYPNLHIFVIDDASDDCTVTEVCKFSDPRIRLIQRKKPNAQEGKGEALNYVYEMILKDIYTKKQSFEDVLISVIDADTLIPNQYFEKINIVFNSCKDVTGLQSKVRVTSNTKDSSQDLEFSEIINATQNLRSFTGTVAFGGNGQFCKLSILNSLGDRPWSNSLVEDFDLSTRIFLNDIPAKNIQLDDIYITQSGIEKNIAALVKQRVRWAQGNIQSSKYILPIISSKKLENKQKFEFLMTLLKPWLMVIEYMIIIYSGIVMLDIYILYGLTEVIFSIIVLFFVILLYILFINFIWSWLYNRKKSGEFSLLVVLMDTFYLTKFLFILSQIYPQAMIRYFRKEGGWDKTKRQ